MLALARGVLLLALAGYMIFSERRFHVAPIFWCASWGLMLVLYRLLGSGYEYARWVMFFTGACIAAWLVGHWIVAGLEGRSKRVEEAGDRRRGGSLWQFRQMRVFFIACTAIGLIAPVNWLATTGIGIDRVTSLNAVSGIARDSYELLLQQKVEQDWINKLTLMIALAAIIVAGTYIGLGRPIDTSIPPKVSADGQRVRPPQPTPYWLLLAPFVPFCA